MRWEGCPATHTHTPSTSPPSSSIQWGSRSSVIWRIGQESRLCVFLITSSVATAVLSFFFTSIHPPLSPSLSYNSLCLLNLLFALSLQLYIQYFHYSWEQDCSISTCQKSTFTFESVSLIVVAVYVVWSVTTTLRFQKRLFVIAFQNHDKWPQPLLHIC